MKFLFNDNDFSKGTTFTRIDSRFYDLANSMKLTLQERVFLEELLRVNVSEYILHYSTLSYIYKDRRYFKKMLDNLQELGLIEYEKNCYDSIVIHTENLKKFIQNWTNDNIKNDDKKRNIAARISATEKYNERCNEVLGSLFHKINNNDYTKIKTFGDTELELFQYVPDYVAEYLGTSIDNPISYIYRKNHKGFYTNINAFVDFVNERFQKNYKHFDEYKAAEKAVVYSEEEKEKQIEKYSAEANMTDEEFKKLIQGFKTNIETSLPEKESEIVKQELKPVVSALIIERKDNQSKKEPEAETSETPDETQESSEEELKDLLEATKQEMSEKQAQPVEAFEAAEPVNGQIDYEMILECV